MQPMLTVDQLRAHLARSNVKELSARTNIPESKIRTFRINFRRIPRMPLELAQILTNDCLAYSDPETMVHNYTLDGPTMTNLIYRSHGAYTHTTSTTLLYLYLETKHRLSLKRQNPDTVFDPLYFVCEFNETEIPLYESPFETIYEQMSIPPVTKESDERLYKILKYVWISPLRNKRVEKGYIDKETNEPRRYPSFNEWVNIPYHEAVTTHRMTTLMDLLEFAYSGIPNSVNVGLVTHKNPLNDQEAHLSHQSQDFILKHMYTGYRNTIYMNPQSRDFDHVASIVAQQVMEENKDVQFGFCEGFLGAITKNPFWNTLFTHPYFQKYHEQGDWKPYKLGYLQKSLYQYVDLVIDDWIEHSIDLEHPFGVSPAICKLRTKENIKDMIRYDIQCYARSMSDFIKGGSLYAETEI